MLSYTKVTWCTAVTFAFGHEPSGNVHKTTKSDMKDKNATRL